MRTVLDSIIGQHGGPGTLTVLALDGTGQTLGWTDVHERARRVSAGLRRRGIGPGKRVGLLAETSIDLVVALQAVWLTGAAFTVLPLPLPSRHAGEVYLGQLRRMIADAQPALVVVGGPLETVASRLGAAAPMVGLGTLTAEALDADPTAPTRPAPGDLAILQYTSGSTRDPRGVPITHGQLAANIAAIRTATRHETVHRCGLSWLPLYHDLGLIGCLALPMSCGCPLVLQTPAAFAARPVAWLEAIAAHRATATAAPNFAWVIATRLLDHRPAPDPLVNLGSLQLALTGAEPVDPLAMRRFLTAAGRHGLHPSALTCGYGLAEATLAVTFSTPGAGLEVDVVDPATLERRGAAVPAPDAVPGRAMARLGRPVPGTGVRIVDRLTGRDLPERSVGRIEVSGPSVIRGYWRERPAPVGSWLDTGDLGYLTAGELVVCGREKDVVFAAGRNVYPQDIEAAVGSIPAVRAGNAVAFGLPGGATGDRLVVAVESHAWADGAAADAVRSAVIARVDTEVGLAPAAVLVLAPGQLDKTSSGKPRRGEVRRQYIAGDLGGPGRAAGALRTEEPHDR